MPTVRSMGRALSDTSELHSADGFPKGPVMGEEDFEMPTAPTGRALSETNCVDTDNGAKGAYGFGCAVYVQYGYNASICGQGDSFVFTMATMCCFCGGGAPTPPSTPPAPPTPPPSPFLPPPPTPPLPPPTPPASPPAPPSPPPPSPCSPPPPPEPPLPGQLVCPAPPPAPTAQAPTFCKQYSSDYAGGAVPMYNASMTGDTTAANGPGALNLNGPNNTYTEGAFTVNVIEVFDGCPFFVTVPAGGFVHLKMKRTKPKSRWKMVSKVRMLEPHGPVVACTPSPYLVRDQSPFPRRVCPSARFADERGAQGEPATPYGLVRFPSNPILRRRRNLLRIPLYDWCQLRVHPPSQ